MELCLLGTDCIRMRSISLKLLLIISQEGLRKFTLWVKFGILWLISNRGSLIWEAKSKNSGIMEQNISFLQLLNAYGLFSSMWKSMKLLTRWTKRQQNNTRTMWMSFFWKLGKVLKTRKIKSLQTMMKRVWSLCRLMKSTKKSEKTYRKYARSKV